MSLLVEDYIPVISEARGYYSEYAIFAAIYDNGGQVYDVRNFGAKVDNSTNDTIAINNALNMAGLAGGGFVYIPAGTTRVTQLVLQSHVNLIGAGIWATTVMSLSNTNAPTIINHVSTNGTTNPNAEFCSVRDLKIDGHNAGTGGGAGNTIGDGIFFSMNPLNTNAPSDEKFDPHFLVENVYIINCASWAFRQTGRSETRLINVYAERNVLGGFNPSYDTFLLGCSTGNNSGPGFSFTHGNIMAVNCKSFTAGIPTTGIPVGSEQPGFYISGTNLACTLVGCIAQNNAAQGFLLQNASGVTIQGAAADSNNFGAGNANNAYAGVELDNATNCLIDFVSTQGFQSGVQVGNQYNAIRIKNGSNQNDIRITTYAATGYVLGPTISTDSVVLANRITANGVLVNPLPTFAGDSDVSFTNLSDGQIAVYNAASGKWINTTSGSGTFAAGILGDGSDGTATLDGSATVSWATLTGSTYTMTRDCELTSLTINSGVTLVPTGFRVFNQGTVTNNGTISANGNNATSSTGATASTSRTLTTGTKGGNGATGVGVAGNASAGGFGVGTGASGGTGSSAGGAGGTIASALNYMLKAAQTLATGAIGWAGSAVAISGGSGGGGGGGDGVNSGGGGGTGGSIVCIFSRTFVNNGALNAIGGNGFTPVSGNAGGGGGGGGGLIIVLSINPWTQNGTLVVTGGIGGTGVGTGTSGGNGTSGTTLNVVLQ